MEWDNSDCNHCSVFHPVRDLCYVKVCKKENEEA